MATIQQVKAGVLKYLASDIVPHMVPWKQVAVEVYLGLAADNIANKILEMRSKPEISMMGIFRDDEEIDIDKIYQIAQQQMQGGRQIPVTIPVVNEEYKLDKSDLDKLYKFIKEG